MSLDVYLELDEPARPSKERSGIFVRRNGSTVELSRTEWDRAFPDREPVVVSAREDDDRDVYSKNITHNLGKMADAAGVYTALWRPEEMGATKAGEIVGALTSGLEKLRTDPEKFKLMNPSNGWGNYEGLLSFVADYLDACMRYPEATIRVSR